MSMSTLDASLSGNKDNNNKSIVLGFLLLWEGFVRDLGRGAGWTLKFRANEPKISCHVLVVVAVVV